MKKQLCVAMAGILLAGFGAVQAAQPKKPLKSGAKIQAIPAGEMKMAEADRRLKPLFAYLDKRLNEMSGLYHGGNAKTSLQKAFIAHGVTDKAMGYADAWGGWLYLTWDATHMFYGYHYQALEHSLNVIHSQQYAKTADVAYLEKGVAQWKVYDQQVKQLFEEELDLRSRIAVNIEQVWAAEKVADAIKHNQCDEDANCIRAADAQVQAVKDVGTPIRDCLDVVDERVRKMGQLRLFNAIDEERFFTVPVEQNN